ncbi:TetR/AcrR family transcriptional regulator [Streptococcus chenjunshii]|uniref:TetR/AcrR family transcriptional regulator n=1 Tax=Streptococcus chenjunshii TaxID=2173853 RepID=A0A372KJZ1_9STRE|nr:TetR/AcrR family transcriptional regulator [Streptococcus chenjunshii]AXQ79387.1 TetR/AcrR family transcriptional regulator [Streptococcus chenjunshii]RFU50082.1 TetR/AcrR family transcriptional regulator [Streptococcus chenjunshii]RFU52244.1 TetR/AcrR family transcriptional regulator [Streptococcus chenjunshii]
MNGKERQSLYSKTQIIEAVFTLLKDNHFDEITVNEILDLSQISRRTFYRYFANKEDILQVYLDGLLQSYYLLKDDILAQSSFEDMLMVTLNFFWDNREKLRLLISSQKFHLLIERYNQEAVPLYRSINAPWHVQPSHSQADLQDILHFITGGYFNIISHWLLEEPARPAAEIARNLSLLFSKIQQTFDLQP